MQLFATTPSARWILLTLLTLSEFNGLNRTSANEFQVRVVDAETKQPISVRMSIRNARGALIKQRGVPEHAGHFCFFGQHNFKLPRGVYSYTIEKGLEYKTVSGQFEIKRGSNDGVTVAVPRFTNLNDRGWWSGDLAVARPLDDLPILMDANGLSFANGIAETNAGLSDSDEFPDTALRSVNDRLAYCQTGVYDSRAGGGVIWLDIEERLKLPPTESWALHQFPAEPLPGDPLMFLDQASAWDLPVLLAELRRSELERKTDVDRGPALHGISIAGGTLTNQPRKINRADLRPVPESFAGDHAFARWQLAIYFHVLNCGFKIPPVAYSYSGESLNPVGYNRVYVHIGQKYSPEAWLENLRLGRVLVTNGPVMNVLYNGLLPGETFLVDEGQSIEIEPTLTLSLKEKAEYLEIIRNGLVAEKISLDEYAKAGGRLPKVRFSESGWMAIRVVTSNPDAFHFALSGPIYIQVGQQRLLKPESAKFFLDWMVERARYVQDSGHPRSRELIDQLRPAYEFWKELAGE